MFRSSVCVLLATLAMPVLAAQGTLHLPADARIDVQVIDRAILDQSAPRIENVLLRPVELEQSTATHRLPHYCLITADAQLEDARVRLTTQSVTCIETQGEQREIYSGELSAAAFEQGGDFGLDVCSKRQDGQCTQAVITPDHTFRLSIGRDTELNAMVNPSEEINVRRRQANGEGAANPAPSGQSDPNEDNQ